MRRYLVLIALMALFTCGAEGALAQDAATDTDRIQSLVQPSIVYLETTYSAQIKDVNPQYRGTRFGGIQFGGEEVSSGGRCTGFFVNPDGWVATAGHCVLVDETNKQWLIDAAGEKAWEDGEFNEDVSIEEAIEYAREYFRTAGRVKTSFVVAYPTTSTTISSEEAVEARLVGYRSFDKGDVGLLKFETRGIDMPGLEMSTDTEPVRVGTPIVAVGFPGNVDDIADQDYNPSFKGGEISSLKTIGGGQVALYEHDASVSGGMSGGPVVDEDGRVIGVTSRGTSSIAEGFDFAAPVAVLAEILGGKVENDVGDVGRVYREGVEALYEEDRSTALESFDETLKYPGNPVLALSATLRQRAEALPEEGFPWWGYVLIVLALLALAGGAVFVLRRRSAATVSVTPALAGMPSATPAPVPASLPSSPRPELNTVTGDDKPVLVVVGPRGETAVRHVLAGEMTIGREGADILLADEQVSRQHAKVHVSDGHVEVSDLGSSNGTEVNGQRITETVRVLHGDTIKLGGTALRVELPASMRGPGPSSATVIAPRE